MPQSSGHILHTPLQSWSLAGEEKTFSLLTVDILHAIEKGFNYIVVENVVGLQKSTALKTALNNFNELGFTTIVLDITDKSIIVGRKLKVHR